MQDLARTGVPGLDDIVRGGLPRNRMYLVQGEPGVGKTTLAFQFLFEGVARGERCLYVTLAETRDEVTEVANAHGWKLDGLDILEMSAIEDRVAVNDNTLFDPADVDLQEVTEALLHEVVRVQPARVVFDSLAEIRLLAQDALRYRRQIMALKTFFAGKRSTVLLLDDQVHRASDEQVRSLVHGVIVLESLNPEYGGERRRLHIGKLRGVPFRSGHHDYVIRKGGLSVFPRLVAAEHRIVVPKKILSSGIAGLDTLLGGGVNYGTATLLVGPAGSGKSTVCMYYALSTAKAGGRAALYCFEEAMGTMLARAGQLGLPLDDAVESGRIQVHQMDPAEVSPGEFAARVRKVIDDGADVVVIDSLNGYLAAMPQESFLILHIHELLSYASLKGVATFLVMTQHGFMGQAMTAPVDVSYIADTVLLLRFFESEGLVRKAISVVKKRAGLHETAIRELGFGAGGASVGRQLKDFQGVLTGVPSFVGSRSDLLRPDDG